MIISPDWIWLHVPKCGGVSTEKVLRDLFGERADVAFDVVAREAPMIWHQSIEQRQELDENFDVAGRKVIANIRRLPYWILSRVHFQVQRIGDNGPVNRDELVRGRFRRGPNPDGTPGRLYTAVRVLSRYAVPVTDWLRCENLLQDIPQVFGCDPGAIQKENTHRNKGKIDYIRDLSFWFTTEELVRMYEANPFWAEVEAKVYGNQLEV